MIGILISKTVTFFIIMMGGFAFVKMKIITQQEVNGLARLALYLVIPCVTLRAFETELTDTVRSGILFSFCAALAIHVFFFTLIPFMRKLLHFNEVETLSVIYPNSANLTVPLVAATLGWKYVIYASSYIMIQQFLIWSHGRMMMQGERTFDWKKIFLNVNLLATFAGFILLVTQIHLPKVVMDAVYSVADMVGPVTMLISGFLLASTKLSLITEHRKWWEVVLLRLILLPLVLVIAVKCSGAAGLVTDGVNIFLVTLFGIVTPPAATLTLMAEVYHRDSIYANLLNVVSTLFFMLTMPLVLTVYFYLVGA